MHFSQQQLNLLSGVKKEKNSSLILKINKFLIMYIEALCYSL
jgi:hypothetical protein